MRQEIQVTQKELKAYEEDQKGLSKIYRSVVKSLMIPPQDPERDFVINVGCGGSPDQIALQEFSKHDSTKPLPVVGVDLVLSSWGDLAKDKLRDGDDVELIPGDATKIIPQVVNKRGHPKVITARNVDAMYNKNDLPPDMLKKNPLLDTSWKDVVREVYNALPEEGGYFVATYKNTREFVPLGLYMAEAGFIVIPLGVPDKRAAKQKLEEFISPPIDKVESDQFAIAGVKNPSDELLAKIQITNPSFTREFIEKTREQIFIEKKEIAIERRYRKVNKAIKTMTREDVVDLVLQFCMRKELDISEEQIKELEGLKNGSAKLIVNFNDLESIFSYVDSPSGEPRRETLFKRAEPGIRKNILVDENNGENKGVNGVTIGHSTVYNHPQKRESPTSNNHGREEEVVLTEIVRVFVDSDDLEIAEKLIEISKDKNK